MRKSNHTSYRYRPGTSRGLHSVASFREQMTDYAKGELLQDLRRKRRMSRENVASEIGVTTKTLYSWENDGAIKWENAQRIGKFYDVAPDSLVTRDPDESQGDLATREQVDAIAAAVADVEQQVVASHRERANVEEDIKGLLRKQNELLARQSALLAKIEALVLSESVRELLDAVQEESETVERGRRALEEGARASDRRRREAG
jgi:transcriptional regulator with XRE-family HTH domain